MVPDRTSTAYRRIVIDDRARLPGRFFGRFATVGDIGTSARNLMLR